jgi:hypothetical protein
MIPVDTRIGSGFQPARESGLFVFQFSWERVQMIKKSMVRLVATLWLALAVMLPAGLHAQDATPAIGIIEQGGDLGFATEWLTSQQLENGAFAGFSGEADAGTTVDAVIALVAAQNQGIDTGDAIDAAMAYLASEDVALVYEQTGVGQAAKLVLAIVATGGDPTDFVGNNPLAIVENGQSSETGLYGTGVYDHAYALMALAVTGFDVPETAITALESTQLDLGGWAFDGSTDALAADSNTTAMVIQALVATGNGGHSMLQGGLEYLLTVLDDEGGAGYQPGAEADANSTALVAQAQIAVGNDANRALASLQQFQLPSGAYFYQYADTSENLFSTLQVMPAAAGQSLPILPQTDATPEASPEASPVALTDLIAA